MITEDYVSFETAKLLEEKGFVGDYTRRYSLIDESDWQGDNRVELSVGDIYSSEIIYIKESIPCPTLQMAMKWLREVHNLYIQVMLDSWACGGHAGYYVVIQNTTSDFEMMLQDALDNVFYDTYEKACEASIKYCLEHLV